MCFDPHSVLRLVWHLTSYFVGCPLQAIDLVDEAAAKLKMEITSKPLALDEIDRKVLQVRRRVNGGVVGKGGGG